MQHYHVKIINLPKKTKKFKFKNEKKVSLSFIELYLFFVFPQDKPYKENNLNRMDFVCSSICTLSISVGIILNITDSILLQIAFFFILGSINLCMIMTFFHNFFNLFFRSQQANLMRYLKYLLDMCPILKKFINYSHISGERA